MKNLKLATKMFVLTVILMAAVLAVAYVAYARLTLVNAQIGQLVDRTLQKGNVASQLQIQILSSIRSQKNAILSATDEKSKEFAAESRASLAEARVVFDKLKTLVAADSVDGQVSATDTLGEAIDDFHKVNNEVLDLAVQNTNVKARQLLVGDLQKQIDILATRFQSWAEQVASKANPSAAELARLKVIYDIHRSLLELYPAAFNHALSTSVDEMTTYEAQLSEIQARMAQGLSAASGGDAVSEVDARAILTEIKAGFTRLTQLSRLDTNNRSTLLSLEQGKVASDEIAKRVEEVQVLLLNEATAGRELSQAAYRGALWWIGAMALAGVLVGGGVGYLVTESVTRPVFELRNLAQAMANGELRQRLQLHQQDEVGQLSEATNSLADSLSRIVTEIQKVSDGLAGSASGLNNVSNQLLGQSEQASLQASNVASASEELTTNISTIAAAAEEMSVNVASISSASEEMSMNVGTISSAAEQTSTNVSVVSTAVEEISNSFADVLNNVREGSRVAGEARRMADSATSTIQLLNQSGADISKVTETIKMIALQTNLLALNATIEAASAGEAGKGFAVVAHEIKELANQSAKAAEDIARKIEGVQKDTRQAVEVIQGVSQIIKDINASAERISQSVEQQTRAATTIADNVGEANKGVGDIARSIAEVAKAAGDMSRNVAEAARGATDVSRNVGEAAQAAGGISASIHGVSEASRCTNKSATQVHTSAEQLDQIGKELRKLVGRFKVNRDDVTPV